jgi:hypothetical protein
MTRRLAFLLAVLSVVSFPSVASLADTQLDCIAFEIGEIKPPAALTLDLVLQRCPEQVNKCILIIDSPGGLVSEANKIVEVIDKHENIEFTAYVKSAISAAVWPVIACRHVYFRPGSIIGGTQIYYRDQTGNYLVDGKFNSIQEAVIRGIAEKQGHPVDFTVSMVVPQPTGRQRTISYEEWLPIARIYRTISLTLEEARVSTYTANEATTAGFGKLAENIDSITKDPITVNHRFIDFACRAIYLFDYSASEYFGERYTPEYFASLVRRGTVQYRVVTQQSTGGTLTRAVASTKTRPQTDAEYNTSKSAVAGKIKSIITQCEQAKGAAIKFLKDGRGQVLSCEDSKAAARNQYFIDYIVRPKIQMLKNQMQEIHSDIDSSDYRELVAMIKSIDDATDNVGHTSKYDALFKE